MEEDAQQSQRHYRTWSYLRSDTLFHPSIAAGFRKATTARGSWLSLPFICHGRGRGRGCLGRRHTRGAPSLSPPLPGPWAASAASSSPFASAITSFSVLLFITAVDVDYRLCRREDLYLPMSSGTVVWEVAVNINYLDLIKPGCGSQNTS